MKTPDITPTQIVAVVQAVIAVAVALGAPISDEATASILGLAAVLAGMLLHSDAKIRASRANLAAVKAGVLPESMQ